MEKEKESEKKENVDKKEVEVAKKEEGGKEKTPKTESDGLQGLMHNNVNYII